MGFNADIDRIYEIASRKLEAAIFDESHPSDISLNILSHCFLLLRLSILAMVYNPYLQEAVSLKTGWQQRILNLISKYKEFVKCLQEFAWLQLYILCRCNFGTIRPSGAADGVQSRTSWGLLHRCIVPLVLSYFAESMALQRESCAGNQDST